MSLARVGSRRAPRATRVVGVGRVLRRESTRLLHVDGVALGRVSLLRIALRRVTGGRGAWALVRRRLLKIHLLDNRDTLREMISLINRQSSSSSKKTIRRDLYW